MKYYVLDGYNVIHAVPSLNRLLDKSLEAAREELIHLCARFKKGRSDVKKMVIVFDGKSEHEDLPQKSFPGLQIIFTRTSEDADDRIISVLEGINRSEHVFVVSDDNYVCNQARTHNATPTSSSRFFSELKTLIEGSKHPKHIEKSPKEKTLSATEARKITEEYRKFLGI